MQHNEQYTTLPNGENIVNNTFFMDLTIVERIGGAKAVRDTHKRVMKSWGKNVEYMTAYVIALSEKLWQKYEEHDKELTSVYDELFRIADDYMFDTFKDEDIDYYIRATD